MIFFLNGYGGFQSDGWFLRFLTADFLNSRLKTIAPIPAQSAPTQNNSLDFRDNKNGQDYFQMQEHLPPALKHNEHQKYFESRLSTQI